MSLLRILHVDDEADIREVVEIALGLDLNCATRSCSSGQDALAVATQWLPEIIVLDVMMPVMDGPTTLARLREDRSTAKIPVVFMTARAQSRELDLFLSLGAVGVISKPFDPMTLAASVRAYLRPAKVLADPRLTALQTSFLRRAADDAAVLRNYRRTAQDGKVSQMTLAGIRSIAHGLAGAAGIFGLTEIGDAAASLEETIVGKAEASADCGQIIAALDSLLVRIGTDLARSAETSPPLMASFA